MKKTENQQRKILDMQERTQNEEMENLKVKKHRNQHGRKVEEKAKGMKWEWKGNGKGMKRKWK